MADEKERKRKKLTVTTVGTVKDMQGGNKVVQFSATDEEGQPAGYETWGSEFVALIKVEAVLDAEVTYIVKGNQTTNRITQIWDSSGNPMRQATKRPGGGGGYGKSPEQIAIERTSTESQTAYNGIIELLKNTILKKDDKQGKTALEWAEMKMRASMRTTPSYTPTPTPPTETGTKTEPAKAVPASKKASVEPKVDKEILRQLRTIVATRDYAVNWIQAYLVRTFAVAKSSDLTQSQGTELVKFLEKGEGIPKKGEPEEKLW